MMAYAGRLRTERGIFFKFQVYERVGKSAICYCERAQRAEQMNFIALKSRENVLFLWLIPV